MRAFALLGVLFALAPTTGLAADRAVSSTAVGQELEAAFQSPPDSTRLRCYWYWKDGYISKEGITKDLEAMRRIGIGGAYIGFIRGGKIPALSDAWWDFVVHAVREGGRLGVDIGMFNCPGWSQSGGPWIKSEQAMRYLATQEVRIVGPKHFEGKLPVPTGVIYPQGRFQDVAVLAFPAPADDTNTIDRHSPRITGDLETGLTYEVAEPFTARSVTIHPSKPVAASCRFEVSDDGKAFRLVRAFDVERFDVKPSLGPHPLAPVTVSIPAMTARFFRVTASKKLSSPSSDVGKIEISAAARVERSMEKQLAKLCQSSQPPFDAYSWPAQAEPEAESLAVRPQAVLDLSRFMQADGTLRWDVPAGEWVVLRMGMLPTGTMNSPAPVEATGLEVDKMSREALRAHFDAYIGELLRRMPEADRKAFKYIVADSYETGSQNWTDALASDFAKRYGYDPLPWLPVLTGRIISTADESNRFLWDLRRMVADRIARDYVGGLSDLCHEHGLKMWLENYGHWGFPAEFLQYGGECDEIGGEFWVGGDAGTVEIRAAASAAHTYGKPVVWAEAFTGGSAFVNTPRDLKRRGDWAFCEGVNQYVLHVYFLQPRDDWQPGVNAIFGSEFNRHNTWFDASKPWMDYSRRCFLMLQVGRPVAEVAYFIGEDVPKMTGIRRPELPPGYDYDYINAEVLLTRASVSHGRLTLPEGASYGVLVLPPSETMRPEVLKRIAGFVDQGLTVVGPLPSRSPSLEAYPACDAEVQQIAASLKGRVSQVTDLRAVLNDAPAVICPKGVLWKHRQAGASDVYFLSNQTMCEGIRTISFRGTGRCPRLWRPDTGTIEPVSFLEQDGRTIVPVPFDPAGSVFVVFDEARGLQPPLAGAPMKQATLLELNGPWEVSFDPEWFYPDPGTGGTTRFDTLDDWSKRPEEAIQFYSGTAVYRKTFELPPDSKATAAAPRRFLDLGRVDAIATVTLNGKEFPPLWKLPYRLDITAALRPGVNELSVAVVNTWNNRLVGDDRSKDTNSLSQIVRPDLHSQRPAKGIGIQSQRRTTRTFAEKKFEGPLQPSGLLGPVRILGE